MPATTAVSSGKKKNFQGSQKVPSFPLQEINQIQISPLSLINFTINRSIKVLFFYSRINLGRQKFLRSTTLHYKVLYFPLDLPSRQVFFRAAEQNYQLLQIGLAGLRFRAVTLQNRIELIYSWVTFLKVTEEGGANNTCDRLVWVSSQPNVPGFWIVGTVQARDGSQTNNLLAVWRVLTTSVTVITYLPFRLKTTVRLFVRTAVLTWSTSGRSFLLLKKWI